jgi:hypothetical protein
LWVAQKYLYKIALIGNKPEDLERGWVCSLDDHIQNAKSMPSGGEKIANCVRGLNKGGPSDVLLTQQYCTEIPSPESLGLSLQELPEESRFGEEWHSEIENTTAGGEFLNSWTDPVGSFNTKESRCIEWPKAD